MKKINIIIPVYNEEKRIIQALNKITGYLKDTRKDYKIIVVNDGSSDRTEELVKSYMRLNPNIQLETTPKNHGKGYSVKVGVSLSDGDFIVFTDVDLSAPIEQVEDLIAWIKKGYDVVIGSRYVNGARILIQQPVYRRSLSRIFNLLVKFLFGLPIEDTQCGFKMFTKKSAKELFSMLKTNRFAFDVELLYLAKKCGYKIKEMPIIWSDSKISHLNPISDGFKMLIDLLRIRFMYL